MLEFISVTISKATLKTIDVYYATLVKNIQIRLQ